LHAHCTTNLLGLLVKGLGLLAKIIGFALDHCDTFTTRKKFANIFMHDIGDGIDFALKTTNFVGFGIIGEKVLSTTHTSMYTLESRNASHIGRVREGGGSGDES
jgi:hypothetical protein